MARLKWKALISSKLCRPAVVSILALNVFRSMRFAHNHLLSNISDMSLNVYYYTLKRDRPNHELWLDVALSKTLKAVSDQLDVQLLFLLIDDTMLQKKGENLDYTQDSLTMQRTTAPIISRDIVW